MIEEVIQVDIRNVDVGNGDKASKPHFASVEVFSEESGVGGEEVDEIGVLVDKGEEGGVGSGEVVVRHNGIGPLVIVLIIEEIE